MKENFMFIVSLGEYKFTLIVWSLDNQQKKKNFPFVERWRAVKYGQRLRRADKNIRYTVEPIKIN